MIHGLFYCDATEFSMGSCGVYEFIWRGVPAGGAPVQIETSKEGADGLFHYAQIVAAYAAVEGVPIQKFRYRNRNRTTGFEEGTFEGVGTDEEVKRFFWWMMEDGWTWSTTRRQFVYFAKEKSRFTYPAEFYADRTRDMPVVSFHSPTDRMREMFTQAVLFHQRQGGSHDTLDEPAVTSFLHTQGVQALRTLLGLLSECEMIVIWQFAYGVNPVIIAADMHGTLRRFGAWCREANLPFTRVRTEDQLPEW